MKTLAKLKSSTRGATLVEYGLILSLLSALSVGGVMATGIEVACVYERAAIALGSDMTADCGGTSVAEGSGGYVDPRADPLVAIDRDAGASGVLGPYGYNDADFTFGDGRDDTLAVVEPYLGAYGAEGADTLSGTDNGDVLIGGLGPDNLAAGLGSDTYAWKVGDGYDTIIDGGEGDVNELYLVDLMLDDVIFFRKGQSNNRNLVIFSKSGGAADTALLEIEEQFASDTHGVQKVTFSDGQTLDSLGISHKMIHDTMDYTSTAWLRLPFQAEVVRWEPLTDRSITVFDLGFDESMIDVVEIHGYSEADVTLNYASTQYHEVRLDMPNGKTLTLIGQNQNGTGGVELLRFIDGSGNVTSEIDPNSYY